MYDKPYEEIKKLSTADIINLMIVNFDQQAARIGYEPYHQSDTYFLCHEELDKRFKKIDEAL